MPFHKAQQHHHHADEAEEHQTVELWRRRKNRLLFSGRGQHCEDRGKGDWLRHVRLLIERRGAPHLKVLDDRPQRQRGEEIERGDDHDRADEQQHERQIPDRETAGA